MNELFRAGSWHELLFEDGTSAKFWSIKIHKDTHIRKWVDEARVDAERLYDSKVKSGYKVKRPQLVRKTELIHIVDYGELERFFESVYKMSFEFVADQECLNDSTHRFCPTGELSKYDKGSIEEWIKSEGLKCYMTPSLLDDCVRQKLIPAGTYLVEVCW
jgi:predicted DNA-binding WGR domain protein